MTDKAADVQHVAHDEKLARNEMGTTGSRLEGQTGGKQKAVAVNLIENPLKRLDKQQVLAQAEAFCHEHELDEHTELFKRAALVAREPHNFQNLPELDVEEREVLQYEQDNKWKNSNWMWYSVIICAVGAAVQGWDQTGSNAANLTFPSQFGIGSGSESDGWKVGAVNSVIFFSGGGIGCWLSDPVNHYVGRRGEIFIAGIILLVTPIGSACAQSWQGLFAARFVMGIGLGMKNATVAIYSSEMAPHRIRGALVMFWQLWVTFGIFLGYCANCIVLNTGRIAWRLQLGSAFLPTVPLVLGIWFCPESPRWLMKKGRYANAFRSFLKLRRHPLIAARDFYYSHVLYVEEKAMARGTNYFQRFTDLFTVPRIRRSTWAAFVAMIGQQMCGINIISFYSSTVFVRAHFTDKQALFASLGFGALNFVFAIPGLFLIDTFGRRSLLLFGFPIMCVFLLAAGMSFFIPAYDPPAVTSQAQVAAVVLFIYLFTIFYSFTEGPVAFQYSAEVFPTIHREQGMAFAVCINHIFAGVLSLTFPPMAVAMTIQGAFGFYAGLNFIAWIMVFCLLPETKQLTLEELDQVFSVPHSVYIKHQSTIWLPYFVKRYLLFRKDTPEPPAIYASDDLTDEKVDLDGAKRLAHGERT